MAVEIAPSVEAMQALVERINSGDSYVFDVGAEYTEQQIDTLEDIAGQGIRVDVTTEEEEQLNESLLVEDRTSHQIRVWIRKKLDDITPDSTDPMKLLHRQIFQRLNNWDSSDGRVKVWEADYDQKEVPDKTMLNQMSLFLSSIVLRVEVEPS